MQKQFDPYGRVSQNMDGALPPPAYQPPAAPSYGQTYTYGFGPQPGYGAQAGNSSFVPSTGNNQNSNINVVFAQPQPVVVVSQPVTVFTPPSYIGWSIFNFLCCFWPLGLAALIFSVKVGGSRTEVEARKYSLTARNLNISATVLGPVLAAIITAVVVGTAVAKAYSSGYYYDANSGYYGYSGYSGYYGYSGYSGYYGYYGYSGYYGYYGYSSYYG